MDQNGHKIDQKGLETYETYVHLVLDRQCVCSLSQLQFSGRRTTKAARTVRCWAAAPRKKRKTTAPNKSVMVKFPCQNKK